MDAKQVLSGCTVLLVDDDAAVRRFERFALEQAGVGRVLECDDGRRAAELVGAEGVDLVLLDLSMPLVQGEEVLRQILEQHADVAIIMVSGQNDIARAVACMKLGAADYLAKPASASDLVEAASAVMSRRYVDQRLSRRRTEVLATQALRQPEAFAEILTVDPGMIEMFHHVEGVARGTHPVFIAGETGTGKELVARALHACSGRRGRFVAVNVAGLDDTMFGDVLFGHRPGAFTGATAERKGMIDAASEGTLFLDEIGDLGEASQVKLLRVLQEKEYHPHGSDRPMPLTARIVTATHKDPERLRQDFYYRLRAYRIDVPALRERIGDLPLLVDHLLRMAAKDLGKRKPAVPAELMAYLATYDFPGNIRELQSLVFDAVARHDQGVMRLDAFLERVPSPRRGEPGRLPAARDTGTNILFPRSLPTLRAIQEAAIQEAIGRSQGNLSAAARLLGVSRPTIHRVLKREPEAGEVPKTTTAGSRPRTRRT